MAAANTSVTTNTNSTAPVDLHGRLLCGVHIPTGFNGGTLTVQTCLTVDGTYYPVTNGAGTNYSVTVSNTLPCYVAIDTAVTKGIRFVSLLSNTNANANFSLTLALREGS